MIEAWSGTSKSHSRRKKIVKSVRLACISSGISRRNTRIFESYFTWLDGATNQLIDQLLKFCTRNFER